MADVVEDAYFTGCGFGVGRTYGCGFGGVGAGRDTGRDEKLDRDDDDLYFDANASVVTNTMAMVSNTTIKCLNAFMSFPLGVRHFNYTT